MLDFWVYQMPVDGRKTVMSTFPSPSKSPSRVRTVSVAALLVAEPAPFATMLRYCVRVKARVTLVTVSVGRFTPL